MGLLLAIGGDSGPPCTSCKTFITLHDPLLSPTREILQTLICSLPPLSRTQSIPTSAPAATSNPNQPIGVPDVLSGASSLAHTRLLCVVILGIAVAGLSVL